MTMMVDTLVLAATPQCATTKGTTIGGIILGVMLLAILVCLIGWIRATNRAHRAEGALEAIQATPTSR
jgi:hypothetical protein